MERPPFASPAKLVIPTESHISTAISRLHDGEFSQRGNFEEGGWNLACWCNQVIKIVYFCFVLVVPIGISMIGTMMYFLGLRYSEQGLVQIGSIPFASCIPLVFFLCIDSKTLLSVKLFCDCQVRGPDYFVFSILRVWWCKVCKSQRSSKQCCSSRRWISNSLNFRRSSTLFRIFIPPCATTCKILRSLVST